MGTQSTWGINNKSKLMDEEYDVIVLGTGLKECVLSGLLAVKGKKVLHLDRNSYYGAETASLNLTNLWAMFRPDAKVTRYLEWKCCDASYVLQHTKGGIFSSAKTAIHKVPSNDTEALKTPLMGLFEKKRARNLYIYLDKID